MNERLDEFQTAQNNAFRELEVAIDKLENHQREMITYFNKQLIALEEEQKHPTAKFKIGFNAKPKSSKSPKNKNNVLSNNSSNVRKLINNNILVLLAILSLLGILALNFLKFQK